MDDLVSLMKKLCTCYPNYENNYLAPHLLMDHLFSNRVECELSDREEVVHNWIKSCDGILIALQTGEAIKDTLMREINYASEHKKPMIFFRSDQPMCSSYLDSLYAQICGTACCDDSNLLPPNHTCG